MVRTLLMLPCVAFLAAQEPRPVGKTKTDQARNAVHEGSHHLRDIMRGLGQILGREVDESL